MISFVSFSAHLSPLDPSVLDGLKQDFSDDYIIDPTNVECRLSRVNLHKSSGPNGLPNWLPTRDLAPSFLTAVISAAASQGRPLMLSLPSFTSG